MIPTFNRADMLNRLLISLKDSDPLVQRIVVVDDASTERGGMTVQSIAATADTGVPMKYIRKVRNRGFAATVNTGVANTRSDLVAILNSDIVATPGWLTPMVDMMNSDPTIAVVGPLLLFPPDSQDPARPAGRVQSCGFGVGPRANLFHRYIGWSASHMRVQTPRKDLQAITGAVWLVRRSAWNLLGGLDEEYGTYFEDADFCLRAKKAGFAIAYCPESLLYHTVGASFTGEADQQLQQRRVQQMVRFMGKVQDIIRYDEWSTL